MADGTIFIYDLSVLDENSKIRSAMQLLNVYVQLCDKWNRLENVTKHELAAALDVTYRTISNWIRVLVRCNAIKYKYSGSTRLNPNFYFKGIQRDYERAISEWERFKNDKKLSA